MRIRSIRVEETEEYFKLYARIYRNFVKFLKENKEELEKEFPSIDNLTFESTKVGITILLMPMFDTFECEDDLRDFIDAIIKVIKRQNGLSKLLPS